MGRVKHRIHQFLWLIGCVVILSCSINSQSPDQARPPASLEEAVSALAEALLGDVQNSLRPAAAMKDINIMLVPFTDADSREVPEASRRIEEIFIETAERNFKAFHLARLTTQNIGQADYIIYGTIRPDSYDSQEQKRTEKQYLVIGEARKTADKNVTGRSQAWISDSSLNYAPTPIYRDSPLYLTSHQLTPLKEIPTSSAARDFFDISLKTRAMLIEGRMAYEKGDYDHAAALFRLAAQQKDGQDLETYSGLYMANAELGRTEEAEKAFANLVSISVEKYHMLTVKYLFSVDSVKFLEDEALRQRYDLWLRNIGTYFHNTDYCLRIVGHASRTGTQAYNDALSLQRAESIRKRLQKTFPEVMDRTEAVGIGFRENIVGTGTDDDRDALDRRVELIIIECRDLGLTQK